MLMTLRGITALLGLGLLYWVWVGGFTLNPQPICLEQPYSRGRGAVPKLVIPLPSSLDQAACCYGVHCAQTRTF